MGYKNIQARIDIFHEYFDNLYKVYVCNKYVQYQNVLYDIYNMDIATFYNKHSNIFVSHNITIGDLHNEKKILTICRLNSNHTVSIHISVGLWYKYPNIKVYRFSIQ